MCAQVVLGHFRTLLWESLFPVAGTGGVTMTEIAISGAESPCKRRCRGAHPSAPVPSPFPTERKLVRRSTVSNPSIIVTPPIASRWMGHPG